MSAKRIRLGGVPGGRMAGQGGGFFFQRPLGVRMCDRSEEKARANTPASTRGYDQITGYTHKGLRQITFTWSKPYADYQDLFGLIYPSDAVSGLNWNTMWSNCVCGRCVTRYSGMAMLSARKMESMSPRSAILAISA